ncbi:MAG: DUF4055 domain-containing protein [Aeromonadaceae bacterium]
MPVNTEHPLYKAFLPRWRLCSDAVAGPAIMKQKANIYLASLADGVDDELAKKRNQRYQQLAQFSGFSGSTVAGFVGLAFNREPELSAPQALLDLLDNVDGSGVNLEQQAKRGLAWSLTEGRAALWVDYPLGAGSLSAAEQAEMFIRPTVTLYKADQVINWRTTTVGGACLLSLVVIPEQYVKSDDGFEVKTETQYRVLRLTGGVYTVEVYRSDSKGQFAVVPGLSGVPVDGFGRNFSEIPFAFFGPENNNVDPDAPMIEEIAHLNIGHFRNSADCEISSFEMRPTVAVKMTATWYKDVLKGQIHMGGGIPLEKDGGVEIVQADPNDLALKLKDDKKADMIALCARIIEPERTQRTATEASSDEIQHTSRLSAACDNLSAAYTKALNWMAQYMGLSEECVYMLNTNFSTNRMTAQERQQLMAEWMSGAVSDYDYHRLMKGDGVITDTIDDWQAQKDAAGGTQQDQATA